MRVTYDFDVNRCIKNLGLDEGGRVQQVVTNEVISLSEPYVPFDEGTLAASARIENGTDVVWRMPYAHVGDYTYSKETIDEMIESSSGGGGFANIIPVDVVPANPAADTLYIIRGMVIVE